MKKIFLPLAIILFVQGSYLTVFSQDRSNNYNYKNKFSNVDNVDPVEVSNLYALGKVPLYWGVTDTLSIRVKKNVSGYLPINVNVQVINSSASPITTVQNVTYQLNVNARFDTVIYHRLFTPTLPQNDIIIVEALPGDSAVPIGGDPTNDILEYCYNVTDFEFNHAETCKDNTGGFGFNGRTGNLVAGFRNRSTTDLFIHEIDHCFLDFAGSGNKPYKIVVYGDNGHGKPGNVLYLSQALLSPPGTGRPERVNHVITVPVSVPAGNRFFVGYKQTSGANLRAAYQNEIPVRSNSFFYTNTESGNTWYDFKDSSKNFNLDITAKVGGSLLNLTVIPEGLYNFSTYSLNIQDTVKAYLRSASPPYLLIDSARGILDPVTFAGIVTFGNVEPGSYYLVIRHRNSIQTWSHNPLNFMNGFMTTFDFTISESQAYGNNLVEIENFQYAIFSGDVNQDGSIDATDLLLIDNKIFEFAVGYLPTDLNGDNFTDASDAVYAGKNATNFVGVQGP